MKLLQSGDIEINPGPEVDILKAMESMKSELLDQLKFTGEKLSCELHEVKTKQVELQKSCDGLQSKFANLHTSLDKVKSEVNEIKESEHINRLDLAAIGEKLDEVIDRLDNLENDVDDLEGRSRRDNVRFYGIAVEANETFADCKEKVVSLLNRHVQSKHWNDRDIVIAHRTGTAVDGKQTIIAKFHHGSDKITALAARPEFKSANIGIGSDLTKRQRKTLAKLKSQGKKGYFKRGRLFVIEDSNQPDENETRRNSGTRLHQNQTNTRPMTRSQARGQSNAD